MTPSQGIGMGGAGNAEHYSSISTGISSIVSYSYSGSGMAMLVIVRVEFEFAAGGGVLSFEIPFVFSATAEI